MKKNTEKQDWQFTWADRESTETPQGFTRLHKFAHKCSQGEAKVAGAVWGLNQEAALPCSAFPFQEEQGYITQPCSQLTLCGHHEAALKTACVCGPRPQWLSKHAWTHAALAVEQNARIHKPELLCTFALVWRSEKRTRGMSDSQPHCVRLFIRVSNARSSEHVHTPREHSFSDDLRQI